MSLESTDRVVDQQTTTGMPGVQVGLRPSSAKSTQPLTTIETQEDGNFASKMADENLFLNPKSTNHLLAYNVILTVLSCAILIALVVQSTFTPLFTTLAAVLVAGVAGATLCNFRGFFAHLNEKGGRFPARLKLPYVIRPITGALTGLLTFFVGNLLVSTLSVDATTRSWVTPEGRLPYIAIAILAGFAAQEFMERLKATAITLFSERVSQDQYTRLEKLAALYKDNVIDEQEYKSEKAKVLKSGNSPNG